MLYYSIFCLLLALGGCLHALEAVCSQTQPVYYAGLEKQPLMRVCVKGGEGKPLDMIAFNLKGTVQTAMVRKLALYSSGSTPYFSLNEVEGRRAKPLLSELNMPGNKMALFKGEIPLTSDGDTYLWLVADIAENAVAGGAIDAGCLGLQQGSKKVKPENPAPLGAGKVFPYKYRVVPYFRQSNLTEWFPDLLQPAHFALMTDIIYFSVGCSVEGDITGGDDPKLIEGLAKLKKLRGKAGAAIVLGVAHSSPGFKATCGSPEKRKKFAQQLYDYVKKHGYDGLDFDWEYPDNETDWYNFTLLLSEVKPLLFELGCTVSSAYTVYYKMASPGVYDQLDWSNLMSYDRAGEHSTLAHMKEDIDRCLQAGIPACKIVPGVPFYSNEVDKRNWDEQKGYNYIVDNFPSLSNAQNTFVDPKTKKSHYFNSPALIMKKAEFILQKKLGGAMIWGYDTDVDLKHARSLARALSQKMKAEKL